VDYRSISTECANSQNGIVRRSDKNRAEPFFLGVEAPFSFRRFSDCIQTALNNQHLQEFRVIPGGRARLEPIFVGTEVPASNRFRPTEYGCRAPVRTTPDF